MQFLHPNRLSVKITRTILILELAIFIISVLLSFLVLHPRQLVDAVSSAESTNGEIADQIDTTLTNLTNSSSYFISSNELRDTLEEYTADPNGSTQAVLRLTLSNLTESMAYVDGVSVSWGDHQINSIDSFYEEDLAFFDGEQYSRNLTTAGTSAYSSVYQVSEIPEAWHMVYCTNRVIGATRYTFTVFYNVTSLVNTIDTLSGNSSDGCVLTDYTGAIFYQTGETDTIREEYGDSISGYSSASEEKDSGYYFFTTVDTSGWTLVSYLTNASINETFRSNFFILLISYIFLCIATIILMSFFLQRTVAPIRQLNEDMRRVSAGDFTAHTRVTSNDEIGELSNVFNLMMDNLKENIDRIVEHELTEEKMKYNLMVSQIDSHFIYNTMSIINALARKGRDKEVIAVNTALIKILQNNLRVRSADITDTVAQEIDIVKQYWIIEEMRYENHASLIWSVDPSLYEEKIPKSVLQPAVENALLHGLIDEETGEIRGEIRVEMEQSDSDLTIRIIDNGCGIPEDTLAFLNDPGRLNDNLQERGRHIGLSNIRQRLQYIYKGKARMKIESRGGTQVILVLPRMEGR